MIPRGTYHHLSPRSLTFLPDFPLLPSSEKKENEDEEEQGKGHRHANQSFQETFKSWGKSDIRSKMVATYLSNYCVPGPRSVF